MEQVVFLASLFVEGWGIYGCAGGCVDQLGLARWLMRMHLSACPPCCRHFITFGFKIFLGVVRKILRVCVQPLVRGKGAFNT